MLLARKLIGNKKIVYSFNMTAGRSGATGYNFGSYGSIDAEPIVGATLDQCFSRSSELTFEFIGDITATLAGFSEVYIDGVLTHTGGAWNLASGKTRYQIGGGWPADYPFAETVTYLIEIKEP